MVHAFFQGPGPSLMYIVIVTVALESLLAILVCTD